jgi:hypothetical protein
MRLERRPEVDWGVWLSTDADRFRLLTVAMCLNVASGIVRWGSLVDSCEPTWLAVFRAKIS